MAGLSVSLDAEVSSLTFRMGDGHTVTCAGTGHAWTAAVEPGTESPDCGYSYTKPSLPDRAYTVAAIANWAVTWTSNGQSGVINVPAVDTTGPCQSESFRCSFDDHFRPAARCFPSRPRHPPRAS